MPDSLPTVGDTDWYAYASSLHDDVVDLLAVPPGETLGTGVVQMDSFAGANDDAKLTAALSYAAAQTWIPYIMLPARAMTFTTSGRTPFTGMKIIGPYAYGVKNHAIGSGASVNHKCTLNVGSGTSAWFNGGSGTYYDIYFGNIAFASSNAASQFWAQAGGSTYACEWHNLSFYGFKHVFGNAATKSLMTQCVFSGHWTTLAHQDGPQYHIGGSDNAFWMDAIHNINSPSNIDGNGRYMIVFAGVQKTSVGYIYATCENDWGGLQITGGVDRANAFFGGSYEGRGVGNPSTRPLIRMEGGHASFHGTWFAFVDDTGGPAGCIEQTGGHLTLYSPTYQRATAAPATFPLLYQTGGTANIIKPFCGTTGEQIRLRWSDGVTQTVAAPANDSH